MAVATLTAMLRLTTMSAAETEASLVVEKLMATVATTRWWQTGADNNQSSKGNGGSRGDDDGNGNDNDGKNCDGKRNGNNDSCKNKGYSQMFLQPPCSKCLFP